MLNLFSTKPRTNFPAQDIYPLGPCTIWTSSTWDIGNAGIAYLAVCQFSKVGFYGKFGFTYLLRTKCNESFFSMLKVTWLSWRTDCRLLHASNCVSLAAKSRGFLKSLTGTLRSCAPILHTYITMNEIYHILSKKWIGLFFIIGKYKICFNKPIKVLSLVGYNTEMYICNNFI